MLAGLAIAALATVALTTLATPAPSTYLPASRHALRSESSPRLSLGLAAAASTSIGASQQSFWPVRRGDSLLTKGGGITGTFNAAGARLQVAQGTLALSLAGLGRGRRVERVATVAPSRTASQVLYRHGSISEFYRNGPYGLEQGFTLSKRPQAGAGSLVLALGLSGSLVPEQVGSQILFRTHAGTTALRYGQLAARDATGRLLPALMQIRNGSLELKINDSNARYPLKIDPFVQQGPKLTGGGETGKGLFGFRVALSADGNTALIGAPSDNGHVGAAWIFTRLGQTWTQQGAKLTGGEESGKAEFGKAVALSADGNTALIGGPADSSGSGSAWVFVREGEAWTQQGPKLGGSGEVGAGHFAFSVSLSQDGNTALIGGGGDNSEVGAAWVFTRSGSSWEQQGEKLTGNEEIGKGHFGFSVALSADGGTALIGGVADKTEIGAAWVFANQPLIPPTVVTGSASSITQTSATLNATVNPNSATVSDCHFEYGTSMSYGTSVPCTTLPGSGSSPVAVSAPVTGLSANTTYHFQIVATNSTGTSTGADQSFTTAEAPEYGRCVKLAKGVKGKYATAACTSAATAEKFAFEWEPGPGPKAKFTTSIKALTVATLETVARKQVVCTGQASTGEYTGSKTVGNVIMTFTGCAMGASKCASSGAEEGEVVTKALEGVLGIEKTSTEGPVKNKIALDLFPVGKTGPLMEFSCGLTPVSVQGSVLDPVKSNKMASSATLKYTESAGKQKPEKFEGAPKDVLETAFGEAAAEQSGLKLTTIETDEEKIEINTVV